MTFSNGGNRNSKNKPLDQDGKRDWSVGICSCEDENGCGTCCLAWICPCVVYGKNRKRFNSLQSGRGRERDPGGCNGDCWVHCCLVALGWGWVIQISSRSEIRARYNIRGGCLGDCCAAYWCTPCELAQEHIELDLEERTMAA
ncbi:PLAC8-domain-containing protein [Marasmius fiardii PR-910]|nr:PLAC8-domain-containing protein [Marasmius fiardii PR-910]